MCDVMMRGGGGGKRRTRRKQEEQDEDLQLSLILCGLNNSQVVISNSAKEFFRISSNRKDISRILQLLLSKVQKSTATKQLFLLYFLNDLLILVINEKNQNNWLRPKISDFIVEITKFMNLENFEKVEKILSIWKNLHFFSSTQISTIENNLEINCRNSSSSTNQLMNFDSFDIHKIEEYFRKFSENKLKIVRNELRIKKSFESSQRSFDSLNDSSKSFGTNFKDLDEKIKKLNFLEQNLKSFLQPQIDGEILTEALLDILDDLHGCTSHRSQQLKYSILKTKEFLMDLESKISKFKESINPEISPPSSSPPLPPQIVPLPNQFALRKKLVSSDFFHQNNLQFETNQKDSKVDDSPNLSNINSQLFSNILDTLKEKNKKQTAEEIETSHEYFSPKNFILEDVEDFVNHLPKLGKK